MHITKPAQEEFRKVLEPFLEMLEDKEKTLTKANWITLVNTTKERIINAPEQYLTGIYRPSEELKTTIEDIFAERLN